MASARSYARSSSSENLPPKTLARVGREIRDLHKGPPEGIHLVVDSDTGLPNNLGEVLVSEMNGRLQWKETAIVRWCFFDLVFATALVTTEMSMRS